MTMVDVLTDGSTILALGVPTIDTPGFIMIEDVSTKTPGPTLTTYGLKAEAPVIDATAVAILVKSPPVLATVTV